MSETASGRASPTIGDRLTDDFNKVIAELENDPAMAKFKEEYEKVFSALVNSNDSEKRLVQKCRDLNAEIVANAAKVQSALKLADEDQGTIDKLKGEVEKAWKMVDASKEKETRAKENVQALKKEVADLSKAAAQGGSGGAKQQEQIKDMMRQRDELAAERDEQVNQIVMLREEVMEVTEQLRAAEADKLRMENELQILRDDAASAKAATDKETKRKEKMERDMKELKELLEEKTYEIKQKQHSLKEGDEAVKRRRRRVRQGRDGQGDQAQGEDGARHEGAERAPRGEDVRDQAEAALAQRG